MVRGAGDEGASIRTRAVAAARAARIGAASNALGRRRITPAGIAWQDREREREREAWVHGAHRHMLWAVVRMVTVEVGMAM
eukprot:4073165-Prymnesium_polylepis.1